MPSSVTLISAVAAAAAVLAALFSLLIYLITNRREEFNWRREVIVETVTDFLDSSFERSRGGAQIDRLSSKEMQAQFARAQAHHDTQLSCMTRLRLLAAEPLVVAAERLHKADDMASDAIYGTDGRGIARGHAPDASKIQSIRLERRAARDNLLAVFRSVSGLKPPKAVDYELD